MARLRAGTGEKEEAWKLLKEAVDLGAPEPKSLGLLADLTRERGDLAEAERLAKAGSEAFPHSSAWPAALASVYGATRDTAGLTAALTRRCELEESDAAARERLAQLAMAQGDAAGAPRPGGRAPHTDAMSPGGHRRVPQS